MRKIFVLIVASALLFGCVPQPKTNTQLPISDSPSGRITIVYASYFIDQRGNARDILVLRDTETGFEYLAVMGAGVTPVLECRQVGKTYVCKETDE